MISKFSVKRPMTIFVIMVLVVLLGYTSFTNMTTDLLPNMDLPYVVVYTTCPGASPEKVEQTVTKPLEQSLATTSGIDSMDSISQENLSVIIMEFVYGTNMDSAMIEMSGKIDMVKGYFDESVASPILMKINPEMMPVLIASADLEGQDIYAVSSYVSDVIVPRLERIDGVASVNITGLVEEQIRIDIDPAKVAAVNEKILGSIDDEMAKAWRALREAEAEIEAGQASIQEQIDAQLPGMIEALSAMNLALMQIQIGISSLEEALLPLEDQIDSLLDQEALLESVIEAYGALPGLESGISDLNVQIAALTDQVGAQLIVVQGLQGQIDTLEAIPDRTPEQEAQLQQLYEQWSEQNAVLLMLQGQLSSAEAQRDELASQLAQLQGLIADSGFDSRAQAEAALSILQGNIAALQVQIDMLNFQLDQLMAQEDELIEQIKGLEAGRLSFEQAMILLSVQLADAEAALAESRNQLSEAEEAALENAGIDGIITQGMIGGILTAENFSMPAGTIAQNGQDYAVKVGDVFGSTEEI